MKKVFVFVAIIAGCNGSEFAPEATEASPNCVVGQVIECPCSSGVKGTQTCSKEGYEACQCPADKARTAPSVNPETDGGVSTKDASVDSSEPGPKQDAGTDSTVLVPGQDGQPGTSDGTSGTDAGTNIPDSSAAPVDAGADIGPIPDAQSDVTTPPPPQDAGVDAPSSYDPSNPLCKGVWGINGFGGEKGKFPPGPCQATDGKQLLKYSYGGCGRPLKVDNCFVNSTNCMSPTTYTYDTNGNLSSFSYTGYPASRYTNDGSRITIEEKSDWNGNFSSRRRFYYDSLGRFTKIEKEQATRYSDGGSATMTGKITIGYMNGTINEVNYDGACTTGHDGIILYYRTVDTITANYFGWASSHVTITPDWQWDTYSTEYSPSATERTNCVTTASSSQDLTYKLNYAQKPSEMKVVKGATTKWYRYEYDTQYRETARVEYDRDPNAFGTTPIARIETQYDIHGNKTAQGEWKYDYSCWY